MDFGIWFVVSLSSVSIKAKYWIIRFVWGELLLCYSAIRNHEDLFACPCAPGAMTRPAEPELN
jgi:hypothetical protein